MPSFATTVVAAPRNDDADSPGERYTRALVRLTREVWHPDCSFDTAVGLICETAADALRVERVNLWQYHADRNLLQCIHGFTRSDRRHLRGAHDGLESLPLSEDYATTLEDVRAFDATLFESEPDAPAAVAALHAYLRRYRIDSLLDAPVRIEGELLGVICHESVDAPRQWTRAEATFAASMGDYCAMAWQIARRHAAETQVRHLRLHDEATGLPNREYMVERIAQRLATPHAATATSTLAVVHVRIDAAHSSALFPEAPTLEQAMVLVAARLRPLTANKFSPHQLRLGRVRADALAFVVGRGVSESDVLNLAERCVASVRAMPRPHPEIELAAAVGVVFAEADESDARVLMRKAEQAADRAGELGWQRFEVFDLERHQELVEALHLQRALREAFVQQRFELHYQPEYDLRTAAWSGAEALLRWHADDGVVEAADFLETAEACDLILPLGRWVLRQACRDAMQWSTDGAGPAVVRVNVSARQFDEDGLIDDVAAALAGAGLPASRLCLEITETTLMRDLERTLATLQRFRAMGVRLAIDDFGTGYSSLVYLKRFPINTLKLDRGFIQGLPDDAADAAIVAAVAKLADALGIEVVAEGVERPEQQRALQAIGVHRIQGWLHARAMAQPQIRALLGART